MILLSIILPIINPTQHFMPPPIPNPVKPLCFVCAITTGLTLRSLTQLTAPPATREDAVAICMNCQDDWSFTLMAVARTNIAEDTGNPPPTTNRH